VRAAGEVDLALELHVRALSRAADRITRLVYRRSAVGLRTLEIERLSWC
jgi:hypothetical protein